MALTDFARQLQGTPDFVTGDDSVLSNIMEASQNEIETYCDCTFAATTYDEILHGFGRPGLWLSHKPIVCVYRLACCPDWALRIRTSDPAISRFTVRVNSTSVILTQTASGVEVTDTMILASYPTITLLGAAIVALGYTVAVNPLYTSWSSTDLRTMQGAFGGKNQDAELLVFSQDIAGYDYDQDTGRLSSLPWRDFRRGHSNFRCVYQAGFCTIPEGIIQASVELAAQMYRNRKINTAFTSMSYGSGSWTRSQIVAFIQNLPSISVLNYYASYFMASGREY